MQSATFFEALAHILPADCLKTAAEDMRPYECDGLSMYRALPKCVALPENEAQLAAVMKLCHAHRIQVVARGAGTGLSGGAMPHADGVVLSLAKFNRILGIDPLNRTARVQPGVRNVSISQAAAPLGLYYAPDPSSQIACTIGGNVAENAGGVHCLKYGLTVHNIVALDVLTITGERLTIGSGALDQPGYDLLALLTGSEGMLAVIVEVTVKLLPKPQVAQVVMGVYDRVDAAGVAVGRIIAAGITPGGLEMMDNGCIRAAEDYLHAGYPVEAAAILLCELDGTAEEVAEDLARVEALMRDAGASDIRISQSEEERLRFWAGRKAAFPAVGRISPDYYCMDGTIPRKELPGVLNRIEALSQRYGLPVVNVFHAGDGNLHPLILFNGGDPAQLHKAEQLGGEILELCVEVGGAITGEHGVGFEKINQMCAQFAGAEIAQFHALKAAFDPQGLLNPGKAVPTLARCAEYGAMRVSHGELPFPELERF